MRSKEIINLIESKIENKIHEFRESPTDSLLTEINTLKDLRTELLPEEEEDKFPIEEDCSKNVDCNIWQVFLHKIDPVNTMYLFYNKRTTEYYIEYKKEVVLDTNKDAYFHFRSTGKTWRYKSAMTRIELARGCTTVAYLVSRKLRLYSPSIKTADVRILVKKFINWLFINKTPKNLRNSEWKQELDRIMKEGEC